MARQGSSIKLKKSPTLAHRLLRHFLNAYLYIEMKLIKTRDPVRLNRAGHILKFRIQERVGKEVLGKVERNAELLWKAD